jgi:hypothetical protein
MANLQTIKQKAADADAQHGTGGLLTKKVDAAAKSLMANKVNPNQQWQVVAVVDRSGSMSDEYNSGAVQNAIDIALGFALIVDDDGNVPTVFFNSGIETHTIDTGNFHGYLKKHRIEARSSTNLTAALHELAKITGNGDLFSGGGGMFRRGSGTKPTVKLMQMPAYAIIITDGVPDDPGSATDAIRALSNRGVFLKFIYVGNNAAGYRYLKGLDDDIPVGVPYERGGRLIDNVDMKTFDSLQGASDSDVYDAMFDEVSTWTAAAKANQLIS